MNVEQEIIELCKEQFGPNLAGIVIFGSLNWGPYKEETSDIDISVLLHRRERLALLDEKAILTIKGEKIKLSVQHLETLAEIKERIYREGSWTTFITFAYASKHIYATKEFKEFIQEIKNEEINSNNLFNYLEHKDEFELEGYLQKTTGWNLTKGLFFHIRRKLQIIYFYTKKKIEPSFSLCLVELEFEAEERQKLEWLSEMYFSREAITSEAAKMYFDISREMTRKIKIMLSS